MLCIVFWEIRTSATEEICPHFFKPTSDAGSSSSAAVPAFLAAQRETEKDASAGKKRGSYATISEELKAKVAEYAAENGFSAVVYRRPSV